MLREAGQLASLAPNGMQVFGAAASSSSPVGFDAVSTAAEAKNGRDLPRAILGSLVVCTVIYIAVAAVLTGMLPWQQLGTTEPLATAFSALVSVPRW